MIIRLSQKLATKIKSGSLSEVPLHERQNTTPLKALTNRDGRR